MGGMIPEKIGRYEIKSELGRGGMATVYRAVDPRSEREVAIKVLPREMLHDPQFRTRFEREAKTIAMLEHPAIVPVYDFGEDDGQPYFVMRYMTGGSLSDRLRSGQLTVPETARLFARLAPALDSAHKKGIIHRDLKPANILFDQYGEPYISDFGIAKLTEAQGSVTGSAIVGTPAYMSPEQAQGNAVDGRSDVYGMGVILFEALAGQQPFSGDTPMSVVVKHITDPVPHILDLKPDLPGGVEKIVEKALAKDPAERFSNCQLMADALGTIARGETLYLGPAPTASRMAAPKTLIASKGAGGTPTLITKPEGTEAPRKRSFIWVGILLSMVFITVVVVGGILLFGNQIPLATAPSPTLEIARPTRTPELPEPTITVAVLPSETTGTPESVSTETLHPSATETSKPVPSGLGGADMIALLSGKNLWTMHPDGSELRQLTFDGTEKHSLAWSPDGNSILYISGKCILIADLATGASENLTCFLASRYLEDLAISPDGTQIAISMDRLLYVVPYDIEKLRSVKNHTDLNNLKGCFTFKSLAVKAVVWSDDSKKIAIEVVAPLDGKDSDVVQVLDISACSATTYGKLGAFPGSSSGMTGYAASPYLPAFDWDGETLFLLSTKIRNDWYGYLYVYNMETRFITKIDPLRTGCCYTDMRWSPDNTHVFFAYQDLNLGSTSRNLLYYIPYGTIGTGATYEPIPMPENFLLNPREHPDAALRPAR